MADYFLHQRRQGVVGKFAHRGPHTRLANDPAIGMTMNEIQATLNMDEFVGRAPMQVVEFIRDEIDPILERNSNRLGVASDVRV